MTTTMLVAISGGHLAQLHLLSERIVAADETVVWLTDDTAQSRSLLSGQDVVYVPSRAPRDFVGIWRDRKIARQAITANGVTRIVSTGSQIALSALLPAWWKRISFTYIESATRVTDFSATGKIMAAVPSVHRFVQYPSRANKTWKFSLSVFDGFSVSKEPQPRALNKVVVTLGGNGQYGFRRLLERLSLIIPPEVEVLWQVGPTDLSGLNLQGARSSVSSKELKAAIEDADVVIAHSGTGSALAALESGKRPIVVPRSAAKGEHVDDHQTDLAEFLGSRNLAEVRDADVITIDDLQEAAGWTVARQLNLPKVQL
jgi:UDP-N-acetylglucosamine--N-acetylmuramyl-(pentapeptide) pyrophosphoryl-undecaprenol N-acetylglucosamine transferase